MTPGRPPVSNEDLVAFADGRLDAARVAEVEAWLAEHPDEAKQVEVWRQQTAMLKAVLDPVAEEPVPPELSEVLRPRPARRLMWAMAAAAAAAIVAFPLGMALGWYLSGGRMIGAGEQLAETGLSAYRIYTAEVRHPVEVWAQEEEHLVKWLTKRLGVPVKAPDLSRNGLRLVGGRLLAEDAAPLALLMYEDDTGRRFTLLIEHIAEARPTAFRYVQDNDACAFYWVEGETGYALIGPADRILMLQVAETVYEQLNPS